MKILFYGMQDDRTDSLTVSWREEGLAVLKKAFGPDLTLVDSLAEHAQDLRVVKQEIRQHQPDVVVFPISQNGFAWGYLETLLSFLKARTECIFLVLPVFGTFEEGYPFRHLEMIEDIKIVTITRVL